MTSSAIERLPTEIFLQICEYIEATHKPSLQAIALSSRTCYSIAVGLLYRTVRLDLQGSEQLARDIQECIGRLQRTSGVSHVRCLVIEGQLCSREVDLGLTAGERRRYGFESTSADAIARDSILQTRDWEPSSMGLAEAHEDDADEAWLPVTDLIQKLPALSHLFYNCPMALPSCLLRALEQQRPECKLHIAHFRLRSLDQPTLEAQEMTLIRSPCLYSVTLRYEWREHQSTSDRRGPDGVEDYNEEALMRIIADASLAPNLKEVQIWRAFGGYDEVNGEKLDRPRRAWQGFGPSGPQQPPLHRRMLSHFQIAGVPASHLEEDEIRRWIEVIDPSSLRSLILDSAMTSEGFSYLATEPFSSLETLELYIAPPYPYSEPIRDRKAREAKVLEASCQFLRSLPPLRSLRITGLIDGSIFRTIREHLGGTRLRRLALGAITRPADNFSIAKEAIEHLRQHCPELTDLSLTIPRSCGDAAEVAIYKALGSLPKLQDLKLTLDATDWSLPTGEMPYDSDDEDEDELNETAPPVEQRLRRAFINSALDEALARSIFSTIAKGKEGPESLALQSLELRMTGGENATGEGHRTIESSLCSVLGQLGLHWLLERHPRDDCKDICVRELERQSRGFASLERHLAWNVEPTFRDLWPEKRDGSDWWEDWSSFSLEESGHV